MRLSKSCRTTDKTRIEHPTGTDGTRHGPGRTLPTLRDRGIDRHSTHPCHRRHDQHRARPHPRPDGRAACWRRQAEGRAVRGDRAGDHRAYDRINIVGHRIPSQKRRRNPRSDSRRTMLRRVSPDAESGTERRLGDRQASRRPRHRERSHGHARQRDAHRTLRVCPRMTGSIPRRRVIDRRLDRPCRSSVASSVAVLSRSRRRWPDDGTVRRGRRDRGCRGGGAGSTSARA